jgi:hypothetical protein
MYTRDCLSELVSEISAARTPKTIGMMLPLAQRLERPFKKWAVQSG